MGERAGQPAPRGLMLYLSAEVDRLSFQVWDAGRLVMGIVTLWLRASRRPGGLGPAAKGVIAMLAIVVLMLVYLTPAIVSLGRELDFVPRDPAPPGMSRFWVLHAAYTSLEMLKLGAGLLVAWLIARDGSIRP